MTSIQKDWKRLAPFSPVAEPVRLRACVVARDSTGIEVDFEIEGSDRVLGFQSEWNGSISGKAAYRSDRLWEGTCLEAFLSFSRDPADPYWELNVSPDGRWNFYRLARYRDGLEPWNSVSEVAVAREDSGKALSYRIKVPFQKDPERRLYVGLAAVIVLVKPDGSEEKTYWALSHQAVQPDFHRKESFEIVLDGRVGSS